MPLEELQDEEGMNKSLLIGTRRAVRQHNVASLLLSTHSSPAAALPRLNATNQPA